MRKRRIKGTGTIRKRGDIGITINGRRVLAHVLIAERALGKPLPSGACVHHANGDPSDNDPHNLVICPDQSYHLLIHMRMRAFAASGNADWRKCKRCGQYDDPARLAIYADEAVHPECNRRHVAKYGRPA